MIGNLKKIFSLISPQERRHAYWLLLAILIMGLLETAGIASIMPFMAVLANPEVINTNDFLSQGYAIAGAANSDQFLFVLGIVVLIVLVVSNSFAAFTTWLLLRFVYFSGHKLSCRLFEKYLGAPYSFFLSNNSAELVKNITNDVNRTVVGVMTPSMQIITRTIVALCIFSLLVVMDPLLAIIIFLVCGGLYTVVFRLSKSTLAKVGQKSTKSQGQRFKLVGEAFGGIKELKILGREVTYNNRYLKSSESFAACESTNQVITILPKYALETIIFGSILLIILYFIAVKKDVAQVLPMLALYAFAGYRLMPGFNQIFQGFSKIRYNSASLDIIHKHFQMESLVERLTRIDTQSIDPMLLNTGIKLQEITFSYPESETKVIRDLNLFVKANTTVAFVGKTGSGKTTLIDIILGLLHIDSGEIYIDTVLLDDANLSNWQKNIGYVPQQIFLADDSVTRNIAFGIPDEKINHEKVIRAAKLANIHDFVIQELSNGYQTKLGERGVRLSGGQLQRIGIARALYHDPAVLIFDEATSALDGVTENVIMDAIHSLSYKKTIIMIAHRITTVKECNVIHVMEGGRIIASGTYEELMTSCKQFREIAATSTS